LRVLKSGEVKYKASAHQNETRLLAQSLPMTIRRKGEMVEVYMGCGWSKGLVAMSSKDRCSVRITKTQVTTTCYDNRNIRSIKSNEQKHE